MNEKYDRILKTAIRLFIEKGIHNTPTSVIAKEAEVATGTLFHYFKNKEALIDAVYLDSKMSMINAITHGLNKEDNIISTTKKMFLNSLKWSIENPERVHFYQTYGNSGFITSLTKAEGQEKLDFLNHFLIEGQQQGYIKQLPVDILFNAVYGIMAQMMKFFSLNPEIIKDQDYVEDAFTLLWDSIKR